MTYERNEFSLSLIFYVKSSFVPTIVGGGGLSAHNKRGVGWVGWLVPFYVRPISSFYYALTSSNHTTLLLRVYKVEKGGCTYRQRTK